MGNKIIEKFFNAQRRGAITTGLLLPIALAAPFVKAETHAEFQREIAANFTRVSARQAYADFLARTGRPSDASFGEFVRGHVQLRRLWTDERERRLGQLQLLLRSNIDSWIGPDGPLSQYAPFGDDLIHYENWVFGFPAAATLSLDLDFANAEAFRRIAAALDDRSTFQRITFAAHERPSTGTRLDRAILTRLEALHRMPRIEHLTLQLTGQSAANQLAGERELEMYRALRLRGLKSVTIEFMFFAVTRDTIRLALNWVSDRRDEAQNLTNVTLTFIEAPRDGARRFIRVEQLDQVESLEAQDIKVRGFVRGGERTAPSLLFGPKDCETASTLLRVAG